MKRPTEDRWYRWCEEGIDAFERLLKAGPELLRISEISAMRDGFGNGAGDGRRGSDPSDPTGTAAIAKDEHDRVADWLNQLFERVDEALAAQREAREALKTAHAAIKRADRLRHLVEHRADTRTRDTGAGCCLACGRDVSGSVTDKLRRGYCNACREDWRRRQNTPGKQMELSEWRWARWSQRERTEGREPSWSAWQGFQKQAS